MATLTADGVNCSNGTLNGFYTGTTVTNTSYPIGSYFVGDKDYCANFALNAAIGTQWTQSGYPYRWIWYNPGGGASIAGTWRVRGYFSNSPLVQRTA